MHLDRHASLSAAQVPHHRVPQPCGALRLSATSLAILLLAGDALAGSQDGLRNWSPLVAHPEQVLVRFRHDAPAVDRLAAHARAGATAILREFRHVHGLTLVRIANGQLGTAIERYRSDPSVLYVELDSFVYPTSVPDDPSFPVLWAMNNTGQAVSGSVGVPDADIDAVEAWDVWGGSQAFRVGVVDSGVEYTHEDLAGNIWTNPNEIVNGLDDDGNGYIDDIHGVDTINGDGDPMDDNTHGTRSAGPIGAVGDNALGVTGVNWRCSMVAVKVLSAEGPGTLSSIVAGWDYLIDSGVKVSSNQFEGVGGTPQSAFEMIQAGMAAGHVFVAVAGNWGTNIDGIQPWPATTNLPNIITVAATDNKDNLPIYSGYSATHVDLGAPGSSIYTTTSTGNGYAFSSGTSMAAPHVAGVVALLWSRNPQLSWDQVVDTVLSTVRPVASLNGKTITGGVVNAAAALAAVNVNDLNVDGVVDGADLAILLGNWGDVGTSNGVGDLNHDGVIDAVDAALLLDRWIGGVV